MSVVRHPSNYADFSMHGDERARNYLLDDRAAANLLVTTDDGKMCKATMAQLSDFVPSNTTVVLNMSGTFMAKINEARLPNGSTGTIYFAQTLEDSMLHWIVVLPDDVDLGDTIQFPGDALLRVQAPYLVRGIQPSWEDKGSLWIARFEGEDCFEYWNLIHGEAIQYPYDTMTWQPDDLQNAYSGRRTSAMMNNGGRNITIAVLESLLAKGVQVALLEMRTGVGVDCEGIPMPEFVRLDAVNASVINTGIERGSLILPVGTGVVRALSWFYNSASNRVESGEGWCDNLITPASGTWLNAWVSGMHEPRSTHLAMGSAIMGEALMRAAMIRAYELNFMFHENGDTHLHLPRLVV